MYRDEDAALQARLAALENQLAGLRQRMATARQGLAQRGWVPRRPQARRLRLTVVLCVIVALAAALSLRLVIFRKHRHTQQVELARLTARLGEAMAELAAIRKHHDRLTNEASRLTRTWQERPRELLGPGPELSHLDPRDPGEAWLAVGVWACRHGDREVLAKARRNVLDKHRPRLGQLCRGMRLEP